MNRSSLPDIKSIAETLLERKVPNLGQTHQDAIKELLSFRVEYHIAGNFTTAILISPEGNQVFSGVSHKSIEDRPLPIRGRSLALTRALEQFIVDKLHIQNDDQHFVLRAG
jgi:hypothetical protein